jgi:type II secretory pathway pseudopilin PulG
MTTNRTFPRIRRRIPFNQRGVTLLETLVAALILLFVLLSMVSGYALGRINLDREEVKRRAIGVAQDRLEEIRARSMSSVHGWDWVVQARIDTTYFVDGTTFTLTSAVQDSAPGLHSGAIRSIVSVDVGWTVYKKGGGTALRSVRSQTVMTRDTTPGP